jgi:titin
LSVEALEDRRLLSIFTVTNTNDDYNPGSLRYEIGQANGASGSTINFQIPGTGVKTIAITSALPTITVPMTIDGTSQPGYAGSPLIELNGSGVGANVDGLDIAGGNSTVLGLAINRFSAAGIKLMTAGSNTIKSNYIGTDPAGNLAEGNGGDGILVTLNSNANRILDNVISANKGNGIYLNGYVFAVNNPATTGNIIQGNFIGTNASGGAALGNTQYGVNLNDAPQTQIGGTTSSARNIISANTAGGVDLGSGDSSQVQGNYIGPDATGTFAPGSQGKGIIFTNGSNDLIGGTAPGAGNVISGNSGKGIDCFVIGSSNETIQGNLVGTDATGTKRLGNGDDGIYISGPSNVLIGGTVASARNIVANNGNIGIDTFSKAVGLTIQGNYVGTDITGTKPMGNTHAGIFIWSPTNVLIGGTTPAARNIISNNGGDGIGTFASGQAMTISGNFIGTDVTGTVPMGNGGAGVNATFPNITIGGTAAGAGNIIANNGFLDAFDHAGVIVSAFPVSILSNSIYNNNSMGIVLSGTQANQQQAAPSVTAVSSAAGSTQISGALAGLPYTQYTVQFFANSAADSSGFVEGQIFLGSASVTTDGSGKTTINASLPVALADGMHVDATATGPAGNTSQFSAAFPPIVNTKPPGNPTPPQATGIAGLSHSKKGLTSVTIGFNEALNGGSAASAGLYRIFGAVKKHKKTVYTKLVRIKGITFDGNSRVTINLAKPYKGVVQVTVLAGVVAANGTSSSTSFSAIVR